MVDDIVEHIARELTSMQPLEMGDIVGMDAHMEQIEPLLDMDSATNDVRMIGIWGMGGIGKTTIAKFIYNKYSPRFGRRFCFIENVCWISLLKPKTNQIIIKP
uniref:NB-ARC domain-containing protein n=1 Tax=Brassica oleracea var. oleracea TaxID=109376 RepID=A0A0D3CPY4_BRAOL